MGSENEPGLSAGLQDAADRKKRWRRLALRIALIAIVCYLLWVSLMILEKALIFFPSRYPEGDWTPQGIAVEDARFQAADGTELHGWFAPHDDPRAAVLFCHGNAGNITHRAYLIETLHDQLGVSVLVFDYRGYGRSEGRPDEEGIYQDARAARAWLAEREGIAEGDVVLMGRSLGGAVAVELAAADGARALILESTFTSVPDMAAYHYPWLPVRRLIRTRLDSLSKISAYRGPLLQSHGEADSIVPYVLGRRLFEAANNPKRFVALAGRDHNDSQSREYYRALAKFLDEL